MNFVIKLLFTKHFLQGIFRQLIGSEAIITENLKRTHNYYSGNVMKFQLNFFILSGSK